MPRIITSLSGMWFFYYIKYSASSSTDQTVYPGIYGNTDDLIKAYNTVDGYKASTTGNISGIYDISGGAWEFMASMSMNIMIKELLAVMIY